LNEFRAGKSPKVGGPNSDASCATAGSIALTVVAGPLNYAGVNPRVAECNLPQPSQ